MTHPDQAEFDRLYPFIREYQALASRHGIADIFQDNGGKILQLLMLLGLAQVAGREGNDAYDTSGNEYELKTVNIDKQRCFTTHHHLNATIIAKYRQVDWYFATYRGIELQEIYRVAPAGLEKYFGRWEAKWNATGKAINNPKIPLSHVRAHGSLILQAQTESIYTTDSPQLRLVAEDNSCGPGDDNTD